MDANPPSAANGAEPVFAGFWRRAAAYLVDCLVLAVLVAVTEYFLTSAWAAQFALIGAGWLYFSLFEWSAYSGTPGKLLMRVRVTSLDGGRLTLARALGRNLARCVTLATVPGAGFALAGVTPRKQALHDLMAGTLVVKK